MYQPISMETSARATDIWKINILILDFYYMIKFYNT